jgi:hypothetical protein
MILVIAFESNIEDEQMVDALLENIQSLFGSLNCLYNIALLIEDLHKLFTPEWLIVDNKNTTIHWVLLVLLSSVAGVAPSRVCGPYLLLMRLKFTLPKTIFFSLARLLSDKEKTL